MLNSFLFAALSLSGLQAFAMERIDEKPDDYQEVFNNEAFHEELESKRFSLLEAVIKRDSTQVEKILKNSTPKVAIALANHLHQNVTYAHILFWSKDRSSNYWELFETINPFFKNLDKSAQHDLDIATPLLIATYLNDIPTMQVLLKYKAEINGFYGCGYAPIHIAVKYNPSIIPFLIEHKANIELRAQSGSATPLMLACQRDGKIEAIEPLLNAGASLTAKSEHAGNFFGISCSLTPLHIACNNGQYEKVKLLLDSGAYVDEADPNGETPLHWSTKNAQGHINHLLLDHGADARHLTKDGTTVIDQIQFKFGSTEARVLFEHGAPHPKNQENKALLAKGLEGMLHFASLFEKKLFYAIWNDDTASLKELIKHASGKELNAKDLMGNTPLIWAVIRNNPDALQALLSVHGNDNAIMSALRTRLCSLPVIRSEIQHPIQINQRGDSGRTALAWAAYLGNKRIYNELLKQGANRMIRDSHGKIALNHAVDCGHLELFKDMLFERPSVFQCLERKYPSVKK